MVEHRRGHVQQLGHRYLVLSEVSSLDRWRDPYLPEGQVGGQEQNGIIRDLSPFHEATFKYYSVWAFPGVRGQESLNVRDFILLSMAFCFETGSCTVQAGLRCAPSHVGRI